MDRILEEPSLEKERSGEGGVIRVEIAETPARPLDSSTNCRWRMEMGGPLLCRPPVSARAGAVFS